MDLPTLSPLEELGGGFGGGTGLAASDNPLPPCSAPAGELRGVGMLPLEPLCQLYPAGSEGRSPCNSPAESCMEELEEFCVCCLGEEQDQPCEWASRLFITLPLRASLFNFWSSTVPASVVV